MKKRLFRGRLEEEQDSEVSSYLSSLKEDKELFDIEIDVLSAHALMLTKIGVLKREDLKRILKALESAREDKKLRESLEKSDYLRLPEFYDLHPVIEDYIITKAGLSSGGMINLGKSRNDQIVTFL